ncbi:hypothetical protein [Streptomyces sp. NPDC056987]|uniref:hypothetical protein n=1 Tax=Streptomyces sp. NPDC056987 TaxID=3345988 RepID=UPI00363E7AB3
MSTQAWPKQLSESIYSLKHAALLARATYDESKTAAEHAVKAELPTTAQAMESPDGPLYSPYTAATGEIGDCYSSLITSLSRVWYRAAWSYAQGTTRALLDTAAGLTPTVATSATYRTPVPDLDMPGLTRMREAADAAERETAWAVRACRPDLWHVPAAAWHEYADLAQCLLRLRLATLTTDQPGAR